MTGMHHGHALRIPRPMQCTYPTYLVNERGSFELLPLCSGTPLKRVLAGVHVELSHGVEHQANEFVRILLCASREVHTLCSRVEAGNDARCREWGRGVADTLSENLQLAHKAAFAIAVLTVSGGGLGFTSTSIRGAVRALGFVGVIATHSVCLRRWFGGRRSGCSWCRWCSSSGRGSHTRSHNLLAGALGMQSPVEVGSQQRGISSNVRTWRRERAQSTEECSGEGRTVSTAEHYSSSSSFPCSLLQARKQSRFKRAQAQQARSHHQHCHGHNNDASQTETRRQFRDEATTYRSQPCCGQACASPV